jgi:hypothetical protein
MANDNLNQIQRAIPFEAMLVNIRVVFLWGKFGKALWLPPMS